jgi:hypothetical protein
MSQTKVTLQPDRVGWLYLAGPMTGYEDHNYPAFNAMAERLRAEGFQVINPADHGFVEGAGWADYLRYDISSIAKCSVIALLPGWSKSKGAQLETYIAEKLGMHFIFTEGAERDDLARIERDRPALDEWIEKTDWLRSKILPKELGYHLADVLKERSQQGTRSAKALVEALALFRRMSSADGSGHADLVPGILRIAGLSEADLNKIANNEV